MNESMDVIIPTFGRSSSLATLLEALGRQDHGSIGIVLVDQNRGDEVDQAIGPALLSNVRRIRLTEPNVSTARNVGFLATSSPVVLFVDDDLVPPPDFCRRAARIFEARTEVECLVPLVYTDSGPDSARKEMVRHHIGRADGGLIPIRETISAALFFRRQAFRSVGGFDELLFRYARSAEDKELFIRLRRAGIPAWLDPMLEIFHDEAVPGGCELRTDDYWRVRERFMKAWAYIRRVHGRRGGRLGTGDLLLLLYSASLNRAELRKGPRNVYRQIRLLRSVLPDSREFVEQNAAQLAAVLEAGHLAPHGSVPPAEPAMLPDRPRY